VFGAVDWQNCCSGNGAPTVTNEMRSYGAVLRELVISDKQETGRWANIRAEKFHQPFRRQCQNKILERSLVVA
jgi:hypothetical protein